MRIKFFSALLPILLFIGLGSAFVNRNSGDRNLQVLPKDISDQKLDSIMQTYNKALGVKCEFCHTPLQEEARKMMRMTIELNRKYFYFDSTQRPEYLHTVTCKTCHQGEPFPPED